MENNVKVNTYLTLRKDTLEETQEEVNKEAISEFGKADGKNELYYPDLIWDVDELYFEKSINSISMGGELFHNGKKLGYLAPSIPLGNDTIIEIIEHRMKKLGKLKTVMEALKD